MQATDLNTTAVSSLSDEALIESSEQSTDNLVELGAVELAMVGGGSGAVSFF